MGSATCSFVATGDTDLDVMAKMKTHISAEHADDAKKIAEMGDEKATALMTSKIKEA
jgi:predicted small metal-binding protein